MGSKSRNHKIFLLATQMSRCHHILEEAPAYELFFVLHPTLKIESRLAAQQEKYGLVWTRWDFAEEIFYIWITKLTKLTEQRQQEREELGKNSISCDWRD